MGIVHTFSAKTIDGTEKNLGDYAGKVLLVVNVASRCGLTPQYTALEALHREFGPKGLAILGFPANEFGKQEPGTDAEIRTFCSTSYDVTFDMFSKVVVKGDNMHPLFDYLTTKSKYAGSIQWNFNKFLVGKDGEVLARFEPNIEPNDPSIRAALERALG